MAELQYIIHRDFGSLEQEGLGGVHFFVERFGGLYHFPEGSETPHFIFACHAALPVVLTADLLYQIWIHFQDEQNRFPYEVVSDLLLSGLCREARPQLFEMEASARGYFLRCLRSHPRFGPEREKQLARFLLSYASSHYPQKHQRAMRESQRFAAIAYLDARQAAHEIIRSLNDSLHNRSEQRRLGSLADALSVPLCDLPELLAYGRAVKAQFSGREEEAVKQLASMPLAPDVLMEGEVDIAGATLIVSPELRRLIRERIGELEALKAETPTTTRCFSKIHLFTDASLDQLALARQLFDVNLDKRNPLNCYQYGVKNKALKSAFSDATFNVWQWNDETPPVLDRFMLTPGGYYFILLSAGQVNETIAKAKELLYRIYTQIGSRADVACLMLTDEKRNTEIEIDLIRSRLEGVKMVYQIGREASIEDVLFQWLKQGPGFMPVKELEIEDHLFRALIDNPFQENILEKLPDYWNTEIEYQLKGVNDAGFLRHLPFLEGPWKKQVFTAPVSIVANAIKAIERAEEAEGILPEKESGDIQKDDALMALLTNFGLCWPQPGKQKEKLLSFYPFLSGKSANDLTKQATIHLLCRFEFLPEDLWLRLIGALRHGLYSKTRAIWSLYSIFSGLEIEPQFKINNDFKNGLLEIIITDDVKENYSGQAVEEVEDTVKGIQNTYPYDLNFKKQILHIPPHATPDMVEIAGGTFDMGDVMGDNEYEDEKPVHKVTLSGFSLGRFAVTFEEYDAFCDATKREKPKDAGWGRGRRPVIYVDWYDAVEYCNWLSGIWGLEKVYEIDKKRKDPNNKSGSDDKKWLVTLNEQANGYRLPTEAEWEYAARAVVSPSGRGQGGGKVRFGNGKDIADPKEINFDGSSSYKKPYSVAGEYRQKTVPVGSLNSPNALGLHDMSGNVYECCWDWFAGDYYRSSPEDNPRGPGSGSYRVARGGAWVSPPLRCRAAYRGDWSPADRSHFVGFRLARSLEVGPSRPSYERPVK